MATLFQDLKHAGRLMRGKPGLTAAAVISLSLGIGACTSIFSVVNGVLLRPLPYPQPDRIVQLREVDSKGRRMPVADPNYRDVVERNRSLEAVAEYSGELVSVTGGSEPVRTQLSAVSQDFFRVMGVSSVAGRASVIGEVKGEALAVVSYGFWNRLLGGRADLSGAALRIYDRTFSIAGVMPPGFSFPSATEVWIARELFYPNFPQTSRTAHNWSVVGRLRSDVPLEQARLDLSAIGKQLKEENGSNIDAVDFALIPLKEATVGDSRTGLLILMAAVGFLLLVACANVANLLLAQATARQKEFAIRVALGAGRLRLLRQLITENVLLAITAAMLGTLLAFWGVDLLVSLNPDGLPRASGIRVDSIVLLFTLVLSLTVAIALALVPALRVGQVDLQTSLKESGRQSALPSSGKFRSAFAVLQMSLTLVLLIGAGLLGKSFLKLLQVDPGFRPEKTVAMELSLPPVEGEAENRRSALFREQLLERVSRIPGVIASGAINCLPMTGGAGNGTFLIDNDRSRTGYAEYRRASRGYFSAMAIPLLRGRLFENQDGPDSPHVAVISKSLADRSWPGEDPIGRQIQFGNMDGDLRLLHIVGIVGDVRDFGLDADVRPTVYAYSLQRPQTSSFSIIARSTGETAATIRAMRQVTSSMGDQIPMSFRTLEQIFSSSLGDRRFSLVVFGVFGAVALLLAATGIYSVTSYGVSLRTQEFGIRVALGADRRDILGLVIKQGFALTVLGIAIGCAGAIALTRLLESLLFGVSATDPITFAVVAFSLGCVEIIACYLPARRATKVDPMVALRYE